MDQFLNEMTASCLIKGVDMERISLAFGEVDSLRVNILGADVGQLKTGVNGKQFKSFVEKTGGSHKQNH
jgi:hypothetical protein